MSERVVLFVVDGRQYPLTVEEAWQLREHLPESAEEFGGPPAVMRVRLEQLVRQADEIDPPTPAIGVFESEKIALRFGLDRWLQDMEADAFSERAWALRHALFVENVSSLAFRDVVLQFNDGHEEHEVDVLVTGDPFEHRCLWWRPGSWRMLHVIDEVDGQLRRWLVCHETHPRA